MDVEALAAVLEEEAESARRDGRSELDAVASVVASRFRPVIAEIGLNRVLAELGEWTHDPYIAAALVEMSREDTFRVTDIFTDDEIIDAALTYLVALPNATLMDGRWAWTALWSGEMSPDDRYRLVTRLIEEAPWDDRLLWMIGDGPLGAVEASQAGAARVEAMRRANPKVARIKELVEEDLAERDFGAG